MKLPELSRTDYGLIGYPLGHSFSKEFFTRLFDADGSGRSYDNFELPALTPEALYSLVLMNPRLRGFNVTAPYKEAIMAYLDKTDPVAAAVGAVNTVKVLRAADGRVLGLEGYNTDVAGFRASVEAFLDGEPVGGALVLGTGGASKAVVEALRGLGIAALRVSRSKSGPGIVSYGDIDARLLADHRLVVNATPLGTAPHVDSCPPFPYELLSSEHYCHDLVYNPAQTAFMTKAAARGAKACNGLQMLHTQALASLEIWNS